MIKLVIFDFDGIFTDGKITFNKNCEILKSYNVKDGTGIKLLFQNNIHVMVISGYKYNKSQSNILKHLEIEHYFNVHNKLNFLKTILSKLNILLKEVAYMGDDINDLDCLKHVKISGVPYDAHKKCIQNSIYVSDKNGGKGCVRDFCEYVLKYNEEMKNNKNLINNKSISNPKTDKNVSVIDQITREASYQIDNFKNIQNNIEELALKIINKNKTNNIYICGVGKSLNIAQHTCSILNSVGIKCFLMNPLNSIHGDVGYLKKDDMVIFYSKSGNTKELINLYLNIKKLDLDFVGICNSNNSKFSTLFKNNLVLPFSDEINYKKDINCIPTNSYLSFTLFTNILTGFIIENGNIDLNTYKKYHPAGNIGNNLKQIKDCLITDFPKIILDNDNKVELNRILLMMTEYKIGCCFFVDKENKLQGLLTDGDIRRLILTKTKIDTINLKHINKDFYFEENQDKFITMCNKVNYVPILESETKKIIGIIHNIYCANFTAKS